jgi:hypothetical protein
MRTNPETTVSTIPFADDLLLKGAAEIPFADDLLNGAAEIAEFFYGRPVTREKKRKVYYRAERKEFPIFHIGNQLCARKSTLRADIAKREAQLTGEGCAMAIYDPVQIILKAGDADLDEVDELLRKQVPGISDDQIISAYRAAAEHQQRHADELRSLRDAVREIAADEGIEQRHDHPIGEVLELAAEQGNTRAWPCSPPPTTGIGLKGAHMRALRLFEQLQLPGYQHNRSVK